MNKRIQKKMAKRQQQEQLGVADAYHEIEKGVRDLANALLLQGKETSSAALASMVEKLERSEQGLEELVGKVPGLGPQLKSMLHNLSHDEDGHPKLDLADGKKQRKSGAPPATSKN
jgi:23S rRNA pseudoU1915 N3-methylase RlmH